MKSLTTRVIAICAALASLSATAQLIHIGYRSPQWGMWIDVVAVTWIVAYFLFSIKASLLVSIVGALIITLFAPDTWLGASMKFAATVPIILTFYVWMMVRRKRIDFYAKPLHLIIPLLIGVMIRIAIIIPVNYYYAIPIWTGMTPDKAMQIIPWYVIAGFNAVQSIIDVVLAWMLVYTFKLNRFARLTSETQ